MTFRGQYQGDWETLTPVGVFTASVTAEALWQNGMVSLTGRILRNGAANGATVFTLAEGYRPTRTVRRLLLTAPTTTSTGHLTVSTLGVVTLHELTGTVTEFYLDSAAPWTAL